MAYGDGRYKNLFILTLVIVLVLIIVVAYVLFIKPAFNGYVIQKQIEAKDITLINIISQIQQQGFAQITFGNQTLFLFPGNPNQQQAQG